MSIVIPARNEAETLPSLLGSLDRQSVAPAEVVVVDAGSFDDTLAVLARHKGPFELRVISVGPATPGKARNLGVGAAKHDWIAFVDAGTTLASDWLEVLWEARAGHETEAVFGSCEVRAGSRWELAVVIALLPPKVETTSGGLARPSLPGSLVSRSAWQRVGGFSDLRAGEDIEFMQRLHAEGIKSAVAPSARFWWSYVTQPADLFRRYRLYSMHNALAGREADWHHGVARFLAATTAITSVAASSDRRFALLPLAAYAARAAKRALGFTNEFSARDLSHPLLLADVASVLAIVDLATVTGWIDARYGRESRLDWAANSTDPGPS